MPPPPPPYRQPPPFPLLRMLCRNMRRNAQRSVMYVTSGLEKRGASGEYPLSSAPCAQGRVSTRLWLAWVRPQAWPASPRNHGVATNPPPPCPLPLHCHALDLGLHLLDVLCGLLLLHPPPPPAASFFFGSSLFFSLFLFFSSFFFSFFLLFLSCSEESVDSSLEESAAGREAEAG